MHGESDGVPGLVLDRYDDVLVVQFLSAGVEFCREVIIEAIIKLTGCQTLYERSDVDVRQLEGLDLRTGLLLGKEITRPFPISENGVQLLVDIIHGHKTGYYLDQRDNRYLCRLISDGRKTLDCFAYTGGFAVNALMGGAKNVTLVDASGDALERAQENIQLNRLDLDNASFIDQDVFKYLRLLRDKGETFDLIILDPPKFAPTAAQAERAARGYKDINLLGYNYLNLGGT